jgi:hypothetical protein
MDRRIPAGFAYAIVMTLCLGASSAEAFIPSAIPGNGLDLTATVPVAMCGRSCRGGGRYIPGPPSVCEEHGLNYCGSSRQGPAPGVGVYVPGTGVGIGVGPGGPGVYVAPGRNCRTVTIERADGSVRRIRRCD